MNITIYMQDWTLDGGDVEMDRDDAINHLTRFLKEKYPNAAINDTRDYAHNGYSISVDNDDDDALTEGSWEWLCSDETTSDSWK